MTASTPTGGSGNQSFHDFLRDQVPVYGMPADECLGFLLPLFLQVQEVHERGRVAPLDGVRALNLDFGQVWFALKGGIPPQLNPSAIDRINRQHASAVYVQRRATVTIDLDDGTTRVDDDAVKAPTPSKADDLVGALGQPRYLRGFTAWEYAVNHHDPLTDVFSLGMLLASVACGLDFTETRDLERFVDHRKNLFQISERLNPVIASVIVRMTEVDRHARVQDLPTVIKLLENYRDQPLRPGLDFSSMPGFIEAKAVGRRHLVQRRLQERLFEFSRRNRLLYYRDSLSSLNLTVASVPTRLDHKNINPNELFTWQGSVAKALAETKQLNLGRWIPFEDASYAPGVLDKIRLQAQRDRREYGFSQLRLVIAFFRWHNLKENPEERIHSPLLLLPCELVKKKGVRDAYLLQPQSSIAEVNPALRHYLAQLYDLKLPDAIDLSETDPIMFCEVLRNTIQASEPGVTVNAVTKPRIELIHRKARTKLNHFHRRKRKMSGRGIQSHGDIDYSYSARNLRPLGLQLYLERVKPSPSPFGDSVGRKMPLPPGFMVPPGDDANTLVTETSQRQYALLTGTEETNPYSWDFDLCAMTLGNFNYRKMTLVRDYEALADADLPNAAFDGIFSLDPKPVEDLPDPPTELTAQHPILPADPTQTRAVLHGRTGQSYIIQGPPGTGKSQTITNLIADFTARGQRVLFVCEKRAAIDVVFHRLKQCGLDDLACLIHDSQEDKKAFVMDLKASYERGLEDGDPTPEANRIRVAEAMDKALESLERFTGWMMTPVGDGAIALRAILETLVEGAGPEGTAEPHAALTPAQCEGLPDYGAWVQHGPIIERIGALLADLGEDPSLAKNPLRLLRHEILDDAKPVQAVEGKLTEGIRALDEVLAVIRGYGAGEELAQEPLAALSSVAALARALEPLAREGVLALLDPASEATRQLDHARDKIRAMQQTRNAAAEKADGWSEKLSPDDARTALVVAETHEKSWFRWFRSSWRAMKRAVRSHYNLTRHAVKPAFSAVLKRLVLQYDAQDAIGDAKREAAATFGVEQLSDINGWLEDVLAIVPSLDSIARRHYEQLRRGGDAAETSVSELAELAGPVARLESTLASILQHHRGLALDALAMELDALEDQLDLLPELATSLVELRTLDAPLRDAALQIPQPPALLKRTLATETVERAYRADRALAKFGGAKMRQQLGGLGASNAAWLDYNAEAVRETVLARFRTHVRICEAPAAQLTDDEKELKKRYKRGRRILEHEFGKSMRYKSIRELAELESGEVIADLKPIWLMSPLSVSDTLPLAEPMFDVVIFDEASQITVEEGVPALYRAKQAIIVGDEMQLPPTNFFGGKGAAEEEALWVEEGGEVVELDLGADSLLTQASRNLRSTMLGWHYRSRSEALIAFSNAAFYGGNLYTIPDRHLSGSALEPIDVDELAADSRAEAASDALLARSVSFHYLEAGMYENRRNSDEAAYIAQVVRGILLKKTEQTIGVVAFSEAQQSEIEDALDRLARTDQDFRALYEAEVDREEDGQYVGLFVKNLENVQGDERDIIILSICYGYNAKGKMRMNFGPINKSGGEKRLNVIFSRSKRHMAVVSSINHSDITNDYNDGARALRDFLRYAERISGGDQGGARTVLNAVQPGNERHAKHSAAPTDAIALGLEQALVEAGFIVEHGVGESAFQCDLAVRRKDDAHRRLAIFVDGERLHGVGNPMEAWVVRPGILRAFGWRVEIVLAKDWIAEPDKVIRRLKKVLAESFVEPEAKPLVAPLGRSEVQREAAREGPSKPATTNASADEADAMGAAPPSSSPLLQFEFRSERSAKFWQIQREGANLIVRFGRIGTDGQERTKSLSNATLAAQEMVRLIRTKVRKGYLELD
ncbi:MAG: putative DNA-binding WGR domain protein [Myxococcota bacterium]|jgi:predicted DNA-binding WGR domain protein